MGNRQDYHENEPQAQGTEEVRDSKHAERRGHQKGPQVHAEGQHGSKTHRRLIEQLHEGAQRDSVEERVDRDRHETAFEGGRRLVEDREQHDEPEKNSERNRLAIERERGRDADGPSDNEDNIHGLRQHDEHRADYQARKSNGLRPR